MKSLIKTAMLLAALTTVVKAEGVGFTSDRVVTNPLKPAATGVKNLFAGCEMHIKHNPITAEMRRQKPTSAIA